MRVLSALMFSPRGGSAQVTRCLARELPAHGWRVTVLSGSVPGPGDAVDFYRDVPVRAVELGPGGRAPMHPSFEDRAGAPDAVFASLNDRAYEEQVDAWADALSDAEASAHDVLHLHHLTPLHEAARRVAPGVPILTHLHGTELLMLEAIEAGAQWAYADRWRRRMRLWATRSTRLLVPTPGQLTRASGLLGVDPTRFSLCPGAFEPRARQGPPADRGAFWTDRLVDASRAWAPGGQGGSVRYHAADVAPMTEGGGPVAVAVGRFTAVKRLDLLIGAWAHAQRADALPAGASLVLLGGHPGEWEGQHPLDVIADSGARRVLLAGWHPHEDVPDFLAASDLLVSACDREQFGLGLVEAMACGLPAVAMDSCGPAEIVRDGVTGWLVAPGDEQALARALVQALGDPQERRRRGVNAGRDVRDRFSSAAVTAGLARVLDQIASSDARSQTSPLGV